jgi:hypothetical protein
MTIASPLHFLEELKGIEPGKEKVEVGKDGKNLELLVEAYKRFEHEFKYEIPENELLDYISEMGINYTEKDIADLVQWAGVQESDLYEGWKMGVYIGSLISILTEKNEKEGKRTVIDIKENRLDGLGRKCRMFDVVKIGVNHGDYVFPHAKGNLLYVEKCDGSAFAHYAKIGKIVAEEVNGDFFAQCAGIETIVVGKVNGNDFAYATKVRKIIAGEVNGENFARAAKIRKIVKDSEEAKREYKKAMKEIRINN